MMRQEGEADQHAAPTATTMRYGTHDQLPVNVRAGLGLQGPQPAEEQQRRRRCRAAPRRSTPKPRKRPSPLRGSIVSCLA